MKQFPFIFHSQQPLLNTFLFCNFHHRALREDIKFQVNNYTNSFCFLSTRFPVFSSCCKVTIAKNWFIMATCLLPSVVRDSYGRLASYPYVLIPPLGPHHQKQPTNTQNNIKKLKMYTNFFWS